MRDRRWLVAALAACSALALAGVASAQGLTDVFGPGELSVEHHDRHGEPLACTECHDKGSGVATSLCVDCHENIGRELFRPASYHGRQAGTCASCHSEHQGRTFDPGLWDPDEFPHDQTGFRLQGGHEGQPCRSCHQRGTFVGVPNDCAACHEDPHGEGGLKASYGDCRSCHEIDDWATGQLPESFDHGSADDVRFPLEGAHRDADCADCHTEGRFATVDHATCTDCHDSPHRAARLDDCADCHDPQEWAVAAPGHSRFGFALVGQHRTASCASCHADDRFQRVDHASCGACHQDVHEGAFAPRDCDSCHQAEEVSFASVQFDHEDAWPLRGQHGEAPCEACHGPPQDRLWRGLGQESCDGCHEDVHSGRFAPETCDSCHDEVAWDEAPDFDHARTGWSLAGAHADVGCDDCHGPSTVPPPPGDSCADCHEDAHEGRFGRDACEDCHQEDREFVEVAFDHERTGFPLRWQHAEAACVDCHAPPTIEAAPPNCAGCHAQEAPAMHFAGDCGSCHSPEAWAGATLDPSAHASTGFVLAGGHARLECADCHGGEQDPPPSDCAACHDSESPHAPGLGEACGDCHRSGTWLHSTFRHSQLGWSLRGVHRVTACAECHATGFVGTPTDCVACHLRELEANPSLVHTRSLGMPCSDCHSSFDWSHVTRCHLCAED